MYYIYAHYIYIFLKKKIIEKYRINKLLQSTKKNKKKKPKNKKKKKKKKKKITKISWGWAIFLRAEIFPGVFFPRTVIKNYFATVDKFLKFSQETNLKFSKHFHYQLQW